MRVVASERVVEIVRVRPSLKCGGAVVLRAVSGAALVLTSTDFDSLENGNVIGLRAFRQ
jgi:hypothetical protein